QLRRLATVALEGQFDRLETHAVRPVRIGEVARHQDVFGTVLLDQGERDLDIPLPDGVLLHLSRLVEGEVEEASLLAAHPEGFDTGHGLGLADRPLELLYRRDVHLAALLGGQEVLDLLQPSLEVAPGDAETIRAPPDEIEI